MFIIKNTYNSDFNVVKCIASIYFLHILLEIMKFQALARSHNHTVLMFRKKKVKKNMEEFRSSTWCLCPAESWYWPGGVGTDTEKLSRKKGGRQKKEQRVRGLWKSYEFETWWRMKRIRSKENKLQRELSIMEAAYCMLFSSFCGCSGLCCSKSWLRWRVISHLLSCNWTFTMIS